MTTTRTAKPTTKGKMTMSYAANLTNIRQMASELNITLPGLVTGPPAPKTLPRPTHNDLVTAVLKAIDAGKDPDKDPAVQAALTGQALADNHQVLKAVEDRQEQKTWDALEAVIPGILNQLTDMFNEDAATLARGRDVIGSTDLARLNLAGMSPAAAQTTIEVFAAAGRLAKVVALWKVIHHAAYNQTWMSNWGAFLLIAEPTLTQWEEHELFGTNPSPWTLTGYGVALSLATPDEAHERYTAYQRARGEYVEETQSLKSMSWLRS